MAARGPDGGASVRLARRRAALVQRSGELRERLAWHAQGLQPAFEAADHLRRGWRWLRAHPGWVLLGATVLLWRRPRRVLSWAWLGWRLWRRAQRWPWLAALWRAQAAPRWGQPGAAVADNTLGSFNTR